MIEGHGGNVAALAARLGCQPEQIVDMSSNINPLGTLPGLVEHLQEQLGRIRALPEVDGAGAIRAMASLLGVDPARILAGCGTTQFIYTACAALASRRVLIIGPTYSDYADGCRMHGLTPAFYLARPETDFAVDLAELDRLLPDYDTVFLCNPNNPTGHLVDQAELAHLCARHPGVRFLIDESYLPFAPAERAQDLCRLDLDNVLVLWSVSKIFGMPGLRAGFLVAAPPAIDRFRRWMQPWSLNTLAQEAVCFLGANPRTVADFIEATRAHLAIEGPLFRSRLAHVPLTLYPSVTSYQLIGLPASHPAIAVCHSLAEERILIRNCANFHGLGEGFIRIAFKDAATNQLVAERLAAAIVQAQ